MKLFSGIKAEILTLLFLNPETEFHVRDLARRLNRSPRGVLYDLDMLEDDGLVVSERRGNMRFFALNSSFPAKDALRDLFIGYFGLSAQLKSVLRSVSGIKDSFIYGSYADGTFDANSDLDVFIIGEVDYESLCSVIADLEGRLSLEINPHIMTSEEYDSRLASNDPYVLGIEQGKRIYLMHGGIEV